MSEAKPVSSKGPRLQSINILFATIASFISILGGAYSLKATIFKDAPPPGSLRGIVMNADLAKPLRLATIEVSDADDALVTTLATDAEGAYEVKGLKEGKYHVKATAIRHTAQVKKVSIENNRESTIDFNLEPVKEEPKSAPLPAPTPSQPVFTRAPAASYPPAQPYPNQQEIIPPFQENTPYRQQQPYPPASYQNDRYPRNGYRSGDPYSRYPSQTQTARQQPTGVDLLAGIVGQMIENRKQKSEETSQSAAPGDSSGTTS